ncbi:MAG TPA: helix-turn-helix transcriptional regulator [Fredinandcohnia sp.]|nr:helix-turn-helix transcriptional regulator [Fredinandcohnia sp.]
MEDTTELRQALARRIRSLRQEAGLTQVELAERAGISNEFLSRIEHASGTPSLDTLARLARGLGIGLCELFQESEPSDAVQRIEPLLRRMSEEGRELVVAVARSVAEVLPASRTAPVRPRIRRARARGRFLPE